jgi:hypothetical protein
MRGGALRPVSKKAGIPKWAIAVGSGVIVAGVAAAVFLPSSHKAPTVEQVIGPVAADLLNDSPAAYETAENQLAQVLGPLQDEGDVLRSKAAEITLLDGSVQDGSRRAAPASDQAGAETPRRTPAS